MAKCYLHVTHIMSTLFFERFSISLYLFLSHFMNYEIAYSPDKELGFILLESFFSIQKIKIV